MHVIIIADYCSLKHFFLVVGEFPYHKQNSTWMLGNRKLMFYPAWSTRQINLIFLHMRACIILYTNYSLYAVRGTPGLLQAAII